MQRSLFVPILILLTISLNQMCLAQDIERLDFRKPIKISGNIHFQVEHYSANGIENRRQPFSWLVSGAPVITVLGIQVPFSFLFSNFENRYYQPFNQYGISPRYKWATIHAGYRNVHFSPFTLAGYRMLGGGFELNPKKLRLGFMYGRLNRSAAIDSAQFANPLAFRPTEYYTRMSYAAKVGIGSEKNYVDISYLKGWDKMESINPKLRDSVAPAENNVIGLSWRITFLKKFSWQTDVGLSHYTNDVGAEKIQLDSSDPKILRRLTNYFDTRISSQVLGAGETRLAFNHSLFGLAVIYRWIDPQYKSMGAYFFQSDIQQLSFMPSVRLYKGRLLINGSVGMQQDNLYRQKLATSQRFTGNANINFNPNNWFGLNLNYTNFGITQNPLRTSPNDEIFKQITQSLTIVPYLNFVNDNTVKNLQLITSLQSLNSPVQSINASADQQTLVGSMIYSQSWLKKQFAFNASANYNNTSLSAGDIGSIGGGLGATVPFLKQKVFLTANGIYNANKFNNISNGYTINADLGLRFQLIKRNSVQVMFNYLKNEAKDQSVIKSFDEKTFRVGYGLSF